MKTSFYILLAIFNVIIIRTTLAQKADSDLGNIEFIENKNQWNEKIKYKAELGSGAVFVENNALTFLFKNTADLKKVHAHKHNHRLEEHAENQTDEIIRCHAYKLNFVNSNPDVVIDGDHKNAGYFNYYTGNNPKHWASKVFSYRKVIYKSLYPHTDMAVYATNNALKYDIILHPGAQAQDVNFLYEGADNLVLQNGQLLIKTSVNEIRELKPVAYQLKGKDTIDVPCNFVLSGSNLSFEFPQGFDGSRDMVIDPVLVFSSYSGSTADNWGFTATFDEGGNAYSGGIAFGSGYPASTGAFQISFGSGDCDVAIIKYDSAGTQRLWASYLGGNSSELPHSMIVNNNGELLVFGTTGSANFPVSNGCFDPSYNGGAMFSYDGITFFSGTDIFVAKISSDGTQLLASTFVGGSQNDGVNYPSTLYYNYADGARGEIITDVNNNVYVCTTTTSPDFPVTTSAFQQTPGAGQEGVVFKFDANLTSQLWSSYLGGNAADAAYGICLDENNNVCVTGGTNSSDFPTTPGTINTIYQGGGADGFITKISADGTSILNSTFYGSTAYDQSFFIGIDNTGNYVVFGQTEATGTTFIYNANWNTPNSGQFISKLQPDLSALVWSTAFGTGVAKPDISPTAFLVDICNQVYLSGWGGSSINGFGGTQGLPISTNAYQSSTDDNDFYFLVINDDASAMLYATFFGSPISDDHVDGGTSRFDKKGKIFQSVCAGCGGDDYFPTTPGAWSQTNNSTNCNNALIKFDFELSQVTADADIAPNDTGCVPLTINFINNSDGVLYLWDFGDGSQSTLQTPSHTFTTAGTYTVSLIATDSNKCNIADTAYLTISVLDMPVINLGADQKICKGQNVTLDAGNTGMNHLWSTGATTQSITVTDSSLYWVNVSNGPCTSSDTVSVTLTEEITYTIPNVFTPNDDNINELFKIESPSEITEFSGLVFNRWGKKVFEWDNAQSGWNGKIGNASAADGVYYYVITFKNQCGENEVHGTVTLIR